MTEAIGPHPSIFTGARFQLRPADEILRNTSWGLVAFALTLAAGGLAGSSLRLDGYGLASSLPPAYYLGLICLPLASGVQWLRGRRASTRAIVLHVVLFALIVWLTPLVLEGTPRFRTSYVNFGYVGIRCCAASVSCQTGSSITTGRCSRSPWPPSFARLGSRRCCSWQCFRSS